MKALHRQLAARDPGAPMLTEPGRRLTGADFQRLVGRTAQSLWAGGVQAGQIVAWLGMNSAEMLAHGMACHQLGAVWMPLNWRLVPAELCVQLEHAGASRMEHDEACAETARALFDQVRWAGGDGPADGVEPGDALLVYTSGTTGEPKGAMHTQASMRANAAMAIAAQGLSRRTRALALLPMFHVGGLCIQTLPTLAAGGEVLVHPRFDADAWFDDVQRWRPSTCLMVPAVMRALVEHPRWPLADLSSFEFVTAGSQIVPGALIDAFHARGVPVAQVYGATETGPVTLVLPPWEAMQRSGRSGTPAAAVEIRLAAGGEILVRAPNVMRGYHRQAAASFDAEGFFHTGDLAVEHESDWYEVVGRAKELIISGGENIHPAEVENLAAVWPGVAEAAMVGLSDERWGEVPVLVLVPHPGAIIDTAALLASFQGRLARFKHPRRVVVRTEVPRTALGKVQKAALRLLLSQS